MIIHWSDLRPSERGQCVRGPERRRVFEAWIDSLDGLIEELQDIGVQLDQGLPWGFGPPIERELESWLLPRIWQALEDGELAAVRQENAGWTGFEGGS